MPVNTEEEAHRARILLDNADAVLISSGAGIGVDSGLPDFRGNEGFWNAYPPIAKLGISFAEMANPHWFKKDPRLAWAFYGHRLNLYKKTQPHEGFNLLLNYARGRKAGFFVFTSNVDGQFQKAGFPEDSICECHGTIHHLQCTVPCAHNIWEDPDLAIEIDESAFRVTGELPVCPQCKSLARPNILMFGDWTWLPERTAKQSKNMERWLSAVRRENLKLAVIEIGAGTSVATVRITSEDIARDKDTTLIRINPRDYWTTDGHISIPLAALEGIRRILS
jgi:NAD-dependent SIR2 family protein deacetylase